MCRRGAELKVMSAVEQKLPGHFTRDVKDTISEDDWGTDTMVVPEHEMSYILGKRGATRYSHSSCDTHETKKEACKSSRMHYGICGQRGIPFWGY